MARDHRIQINGARVDYTCENRRYRTNTAKGEPHGKLSQTRGSVFDQPLASYGAVSLWLEHVVEISTGSECYWFMWYDGGQPTMPMSGVLDKPDIANMQRLFTAFLP